jgi:hypothetical protein
MNLVIVPFSPVYIYFLRFSYKYSFEDSVLNQVGKTVIHDVVSEFGKA